MTRVYLPSTLAVLASAYVSGRFDAGHEGHAVTPGLREWYTEGDLEELEYVAFTDAAEASLRLLDLEVVAEEKFENRRVVVAADVDDSCVETVSDVGDGRGRRSAVRVTCTVPMSAVASVHVDGDEARRSVAEAIRALPAAAEQDEDALFVLDEAASHELLWYDVSEIVDLI